MQLNCGPVVLEKSIKLRSALIFQPDRLTAKVSDLPYVLNYTCVRIRSSPAQIVSFFEGENMGNKESSKSLLLKNTCRPLFYCDG